MEATNAKVIPYHKSNRGRAVKNAPRKQAAGRKAFQGEYCEIHSGLDDNGERYLRYDPDGNEMFGGTGCAKFSHLRTDGLGIHKSPIYRRFLVVLTRLIKPVFIIGFAAFSVFLAYHFIGGALHVNNTLPGSTDGRMSNNVRHSSPNGVPNSGTKPANPTPRVNPSSATTGNVKK